MINSWRGIMEDFRRCFFKILRPLFMFLNLFSVFPVLSAYTLPEKHFINCGSNSSSLFGNRTFFSDENSVLFTAAGRTFSDSDPSPEANLSAIYQTARIFKNPSYYELQTNQTGTYVLRLHFYPFSSSQNNLTHARFDVVVSKVWVLSNFSVPNKTSAVKEFLVSVKESKIRVEFNPQESSFAFINAIEMFVAPDNFIPGSALSGTGDNVFQVIHRINVGGSAIPPGNDTLMREWVGDDRFLFSKGVAKNATRYSKKPNYFDGGASEYDAPDYVYQTAKEGRKTDQNGGQRFNVTWSFNVEESVSHFVRLHFCNIISEVENGTEFNLYVNGGLSRLIRPQDVNPSPGSPFYFDCVVDSDGSGVMNISVGVLDDELSQAAFLNGVEIMQVIRGEENSRGKKKWVFVVIGGCLVVVFLAGIALFFCLKSRRRKPREGDGGGTEMTSVFCMSPDMNLELRVPLVEVILATNRFDPKNMIGEGGFGKVYKGTLQNGVKVAVKRSEPGHGQGLHEFHTEIMVLSRIRHRHLVSLIGYCSEQEEMILVYEFMEKGTLRDHLYSFKPQQSGRSGSFSVLSWDQRLEICIGAAKGLHYLHTGLDGPIIHRDIKSANILLDENYVAKVADFGLSRSGPNDLSHISTDVKGSFGYLDPEYFRCLQLTQKSDVYSFGVVLLEALCARPAVNNMLAREEVNLADWGMFWQKKGELDKIIDPLLVGKIDPNSLRKFGETVEKCLQEYGVDRPNMVDVVWDLKYALQLHHTAMKRELQPEDDSRTGYSWQLPPPVFHRFPSHIMPIDRDEETEHLTDSLGTSHSSPSAVFSQLRINDAR
ncbi:PREDICTED: probable receptor-like protein kinase At5g24010 [Ipomoea nil]|uniref:probable receptor-like protein kinase At5g24010 n=1 Tax=Ipomoea nil TaxID=35883 RepID=UPI000902002C|nr:PREDICTED: probable receptor-like protein kinase At5g24010 [Ipomoea nil]